MAKDNLEDFFKNRAEGYEFQYRESDWEHLESKLELLVPVIPWFTKIRWMLIGAGIMALFLVGFWSITQYLQSPEQLTTPADLAASKYANDENTNAEIANEKNAFDNSSDAESTNDEIKNEKNITDESTNGLNSDQIVETRPRNQEVAKPDHEPLINSRTAVSNQLENSLSEDETKSDISSLDYSDIASQQFGEEHNAVFINEEDHQLNNSLIENDNSDYFSVAPCKINYEPYAYTLPGFKLHWEEMTAVDEPIFRRAAAYSLVGAADFSGTNQSKLGTAKIRMGVNAEYFFLPQVSIGVGVNIADKTYSAKGTEYSPGSGYWTYGVVPETTSAECLVLDVPVTISFYQPIAKRSALAIQAGASSWFMLREAYYYEYEVPDPHLISYWHVENENRYWFGVINVSIGYEYAINNKWSVLAGPYFNFPLTGVGHGNVNLKSLGLKAAVRFNQYKFK